MQMIAIKTESADLNSLQYCQKKMADIVEGLINNGMINLSMKVPVYFNGINRYEDLCRSILSLWSAALSDIPALIIGNQLPTQYQIQLFDNMDTSSTNQRYGAVARAIAATFLMELPKKEKPLFPLHTLEKKLTKDFTMSDVKIESSADSRQDVASSSPNKKVATQQQLEEYADLLHSIICTGMRSHDYRVPPFIQDIKDPRRKYQCIIHTWGVALHNIPQMLVNKEIPYMSQILGFDDLDPSATDSEWGSWAKKIAAIFELDLPKKTNK
jgi:hypothetical protein